MRRIGNTSNEAKRVLIALLIWAVGVALSGGLAAADRAAAQGDGVSARIYLPALHGQPAYSAQFATQVDANLDPVAPAARFSYGIAEVYAVLRVNGAAGQRWRTEWYRDGLRIPGLVSSGSIPAGNDSARLVRRLSYAGSGPLPAGAYTIRLYLNDKKALEAGFSIVR